MENGSYVPGAVAAVAMSTMEAIIARKAAAAAAGMDDSKVTLEQVVLNGGTQEQIFDRVITRMMEGKYTAPLRAFCPTCGNEIPNTAKFCISCGGDMSAEPPTTPMKPLSGEPSTGNTARLA